MEGALKKKGLVVVHWKKMTLFNIERAPSEGKGMGSMLHNSKIADNEVGGSIR